MYKKSCLMERFTRELRIQVHISFQQLSISQLERWKSKYCIIFFAVRVIKREWKKGWTEIPEIMGAHVLSTIGLIGLGIISYKYRNYVHIPRTFDEPLCK